MAKTEEQTFEGLICKPIEQFGVVFNDIKIPKGWRLPTVQEGIDLVNNEKFVKWSKFDDKKHDFYCQQCFKRNKNQTVWLCCDSDGFGLCANFAFFNSPAVRGVLLVKNGKN